jgi:diadenosine tetraphosphatase ApaH/serine/threonine PP2A family protein phosphatase
MFPTARTGPTAKVVVDHEGAAPSALPALRPGPRSLVPRGPVGLPSNHHR